MHFWSNIPYLVFAAVILYSFFSPIIDWIIFDTNWYIWGPIDFVLYIIWYFTFRTKYWNRLWYIWNFHLEISKGWCWDIQYDCTTPVPLYFEKPSGHVVEKVKRVQKEEDC